MIWKRFAFFLSLFYAFGLSLILLPSQVQAYDVTTSISPTGRSWEWGNDTYWYETQLNGDGEYNWATTNDAIYWGRFMNNQRADNTWILKGVTSGTTIDFKKDHYYKTQLQITIQGYSYNAYSYGVQTPQINRIQFLNGTPYHIVSVNPIETTCFEELNGIFIPDPTTGTFTNVGIGKGCFRGSIKYEFVVKADADATGKFMLGNNSAWMLQSLVGIAKGWNLGFVFAEPIEEFKLDDMNAINQQQQDAGEQAQQDGQQGSSTSQNDAQNASTTLLGAFNGFVGAITAISPSNCNISGNFGHLDVGTLNLCQDSPPAFVATILSLVSVALLVPLSIHLSKRMISLFRSFTNG